MHCYLNTLQTANFPIGLGFGKAFFSQILLGGNAENQRFRIWVDEDMQTKSYCTSKDETYDDGVIAMNNISEFKINEIEIWGVPTINFNKISYITPPITNQQPMKLQSSTDLMFQPIEHKPIILNQYPTKKFTLDNMDFLSKYEKKPLLNDTPTQNAFPTINYELDKKKFLDFTGTQSFVLQERKTDNLTLKSQATPVLPTMNIEDLIRQSELRFNKQKLPQLQESNNQNLFENDGQESKNLTFGETSPKLNYKYSTKSQNIF